MCQVSWNKIGTVGFFFLFCSKFLYGNDRETKCLNGGIPKKSLKNVRVAGKNLGTVAYPETHKVLFYALIFTFAGKIVTLLHGHPCRMLT